MIYLSHRHPNGKAGDSFKRQQETWRRAYAEAASLRERFPQVGQLVVNMSFADVRRIGSYSAQMRSFSGSAKAFFAIACPRTLCLDGGFDLDSVVLELLEAGKTTSTGTLECPGWVDPTRSERARCLLHVQYRVQVLYDAPEPGPPGHRARV